MAASTIGAKSSTNQLTVPGTSTSTRNQVNFGQESEETPPPSRFKSPGIPCDHWDDFCLRQLFDPKYIDHLPVKDQLKYYKRRNLAKSKLYNTARKVWGDRHLGSRWRHIETYGGGGKDTLGEGRVLEEHQRCKRFPNYPPAHEGGTSETAGRTLLWNDDEDFPDMKSSEFYVPRNKKQPLGPIQKASSNQNTAISASDKAATNQIEALKLQANIEELKERQKKEENYRKWVAGRQELRHGLDRMDDLERWLSTKPEISPIEAVVLKRFLEWRFEREEALKKRTPTVRTPSSSTTVPPDIDRPLPIMIAVLEAYLQEHKLRLIDYFAMTDKAKKWSIGRDEMRGIIAWTKLPVTDAELDDFIQYLDHKGGGYLQYKDIAVTRNKFLTEERKAILAEYGGEIGAVLAQQRRMKAAAEREAQRLRKAEELRNRRREASFVAYEGDNKLYKVTYGDPRKSPPGGHTSKTAKGLSNPAGQNPEGANGKKSSGNDSGKSNASDILTRRRKETIEMRRRLAKSKINSAPPEGRSTTSYNKHNNNTSKPTLLDEKRKSGVGGSGANMSDADDTEMHTTDDHVNEFDEVNSIAATEQQVKREEKRRNKSAAAVTVTWSEHNQQLHIASPNQNEEEEGEGGDEHKKSRRRNRNDHSAAATVPEREWTPVQIERFKELGVRRLGEILTSRSPSVPPSEPHIPEDPESPFIRTPTPPAVAAGKAKSPIYKSASALIPRPKGVSGRSGSVATTLLETPHIDTNETIDFDAEVFFEKAKRHQFNSRMSRENSRMSSGRGEEGGGEEIVPLMVKSGDREVDSHLAFCTRWDPLHVHEKRQKFRQLTWMEYEKCVDICERKGIPFTEKTLKRALLHPGDVRLTKKDPVRIPGTHYTDEAYKKTRKPPLGEDSDNDEEESEYNVEYLAVTNITNALFNLAHNLNNKKCNVPAAPIDHKDDESKEQQQQQHNNTNTTTTTAAGGGDGGGPAAEEEGQDNVSTASSDLDSVDYKVFKPKAKNASNPACLYPKYRPPRDKEAMKLSTGPAFVSSKVDNWLSYKDFLNFSQGQYSNKRSITTDRTLNKSSYYGFYDERKTWPGQSYKVRLPEHTRVKPAANVMFVRKQPSHNEVQFKEKTTIYSHLIK